MSEHAQEFVTHLRRLGERDRAAMAILRRSLAFPPGGFPPAYPYVERFVGEGRREQDSFRLALYLTAGLYALNPAPSSNTLARSLGVLMAQRGSESIEKRFIALLGADDNNVGQYLRQIVTLLKADGVGLDYVALLADLSHWLNPFAAEARDRIRQRWARDFYRVLTPSTNASEFDQSTNDTPEEES